MALFPGCRLHLMQVDSVQRWMEDLKLMTECECMCVLQAKPISLEEDAQGDLILAGGSGPGDPLQLLLKRGWVISTELRRIDPLAVWDAEELYKARQQGQVCFLERPLWLLWRLSLGG